MKNRTYRIILSATLTAVIALTALTSTSCRSSGGYWGVEQRYDIPGGQAYYGVGGQTGPRYDKHYYKEHRKRAKKLAKERRKYEKKMLKRARKAAKEHEKAHRHGRH